jgi:serine/threonine protein kinase
MEKLDKYEILEKIGVGGFGVVYKATDPFIKRFVAIKTCTSADTETRERFAREAEIAGNLHHRNIVTVYDFGFHGETPYLVQEYLTGEDLDRKIKRHEFLPMPAKVLYLVQIARGLQYAHAQGVIHRDVKPANIRILEDDTAKIMDFGIAKLAREQQSLTQAGITLGTAAYLAPEQIKGQSSGPRTDIFSFGALAYELVSTERPFSGAEISTIFYRILNEEVTPLRQVAPDCPHELERIIHRCLEKEPAKRYQNCDGLVHDLEEIGKRRAALIATAPPGTSTVTTPLQRPSGHSATVPTLVSASQSEATRANRADVPRPASMNLGDVELDAPRGNGAASAGLNTMSFRSASRGRGGLVRALVAVALVAVGAWVLWRVRDERAGGAEPLSAATANDAPSTSAETDPAATLTPAPEGEPAAGSTAPGNGVTPGPGTDPATAAAVEPPAPEPPPPPAPAVLIVAPAWDSSMTVRVGKKSWALDRERRFELEAGAYKVRFAIAGPLFSHDQEQSVRLAEGETKRISSPIARPGRFTVQPHLNTRQGHVRIDGEAAGSTPIRGRYLAAGAHRIEIAADAMSPPVLTESVEIASDQETILSFDLDARIERKISTRPALPN